MNSKIGDRFWTECMFTTFYGTEVPHPKCKSYFQSSREDTMFCRFCAKKASQQRKLYGNNGIAHPDNKYNMININDMKILSYAQFRKLSPEKIVALGTYGINYIFLKLK